MRPSISQVVAAYKPKFENELRNEWAIALLYRPVSLVVTPFIAALGAAPNTITAIGFLCALTLPWLACTAGAQVAMYVGLLGVACCILDCIDGDLARVTGQISRLGAYLDFLSDTVYRVALYSALGLLVDARVAPVTDIWHIGSGGGLCVGLICALSALIARLCRLYGQALYTNAVRAKADPPAHSAVNLSARAKIFAFLSGMDHLLPLAIIFFDVIGHLPILLAWLVAYSLGDLLITQKSILARLG